MQMVQQIKQKIDYIDNFGSKYETNYRPIKQILVDKIFNEANTNDIEKLLDGINSLKNLGDKYKSESKKAPQLMEKTMKKLKEEEANLEMISEDMEQEEVKEEEPVTGIMERRRSA